MAGLYIHIPFCTSRCIYCGFYSTTLSEMKDKYVDAICKEIKLRKDYLIDEKIDTIYLGGGTPSTLSAEQLEKIFYCIYNDVYNGCKPFETTIECNPDDVTEMFADTISRLPVNRISMGAQTFCDKRLRFLRRRHCANDVGIAVKRLRQIGIRNISIDLIYGFPNETLEDWQKDISEAIRLGIEHISAYSLMIEEGTPLYDMMESGKISEINEELSRKMYETLIDRMENAGFEHYEISNFAKEGKRSKHNSCYWNSTHYIGIGAAAHSYNGNSRQWNVSDINEYIKNIEVGTIPADKEILDFSTRYDDLITTALRTKDGINLNKLVKEFGIEYRDFLIDNAKQYTDRNLMIIDDNNIRISREGLFISDAIMRDLMHV
ncbi:radical SAM family heme chaperone HemW [Xylanibacter oryzae]|uniref:radical SAM family heme chaperone HemW n=1 Tax=Xylanibacter oryzae TaxID=185293 RepID=UPI0004B8E134|nr:radical SAM family heme chaperone HemW [Xylanibacter oryzae]